jgi:hypothetical protein
VGSVRLDVRLLRDLKRRCASNAASEVHVGVFAEKNERTPTPRNTDTPRVLTGHGLATYVAPALEEPWSNAQIGYAHEFGAGAPRRSFLFQPLFARMSGELAREDINEGDLFDTTKGLLTSMARIAKNVVDGAFDSGGYGAWAPLKREYAKTKYRNAGLILIEFGQLRRSISTRIVPKS